MATDKHKKSSIGLRASRFHPLALKQRLSSAMKLNRKTLTVVTLLVVAVGGYLIYRSLASTPVAIPTIPDTNYAIPAGAVFVAPSGNNTNAGTETAPLATIAAALSKAASGGTIVLRAGIYHEGELTITKLVTIQAYPHEQAWLDGTIAQSTGWVADGTTWRLDNSPSLNLCKSSCTEDPTQIDPAYPMSWSPQMVFRDDAPLGEVSSKAGVVAGKFYFDTATNALYVGDNPSGHTTEITTKRRALMINVSGVTIRGIGIRRYGSIQNPSTSPYYFAEAMTNSGVGNVVFENNLFYQSASRGLFIGNSSGIIVRGNIFQSNGMNGFDMNKATGTLFEQNQVLYNNTEHFSNSSPCCQVVAGVKVATSSASTIQDNVFDGNDGQGLWCDLKCTNMTIVRNVIRNNTKEGLFYEVSDTGTIASNLIYNNGRGMAVGSANTRVYNNTVVNNGTGIIVYDDNRVGGATGTAGLGPDSVNDQVVNNIIASNGSSDRCGQINLMDACDAGQSTGPQMFTSAASLDYNLYLRPTGTPSNLITWYTASGTKSNYASLTAARSALGVEAHGVDSNLALTSVFSDPANGNYNLKAGSPALGVGIALPSDLAVAIGVPASPVNLGALTWPGIAQTDTTAPTVTITGPLAGADITTGSAVITTSTSDNIGVVRAEIYINGVLVKNDVTSPYTYTWDTSVEANGSYTLMAKVFDAAGNMGQSSPRTVTITNADAVAPTVSLVAPNSGSTVNSTVSLSASAGDNIGVSKVEFYQGTTLLASDPTPSYDYSWDTKSVTNGNYSLTAKAYDAAGNVTTSSPAAVTVANADTVAPSVSITAPLAGASINGTVGIAATATDNVGVTKVDFGIDAAAPQTDTTSPYGLTWNTTTVVNGTHTIVATAYDAAGNKTTTQTVVTVANPDTTPPSTPTGLAATATSPTNVNLTWAASSDNVGVTGYYIVRNGTTIAQTAASTSYSDTTVLAGISYSYQVMAFDARGNTSGLSAAAAVTTPSPPDTTAPTAPTALTATPVGAFQVNLTWTKSTDNVGVQSYDVYRDRNLIGTVTTNAFGDASVFASTTYVYFVKARDAAGNVSAASNTASAATPASSIGSTVKGTVYYHTSTSTKQVKLAGAVINVPYNGIAHYFTSGTNGVYTIGGLPASTYVIIYSKTGYTARTYSITLSASQTKTQNADLTKN